MGTVAAEAATARCARRGRCMGATLGARVEREESAGSDVLCRHGGAEVGNTRDTLMRWRPWSLSSYIPHRASGVAHDPDRPAPVDCATTKRQPLPVLTKWTSQVNPFATSVASRMSPCRRIVRRVRARVSHQPIPRRKPRVTRGARKSTLAPMDVAHVLIPVTTRTVGEKDRHSGKEDKR